MTEAERIALLLRNTAFGRVMRTALNYTDAAKEGAPVAAIVDAAKALADHCPGNSVEATVTHRMHMVEAFRLLEMAMRHLVIRLEDEEVCYIGDWFRDWLSIYEEIGDLEKVDMAKWIKEETDREREHRAEHGEPYGSYREGDE